MLPNGAQTLVVPLKPGSKEPSGDAKPVPADLLAIETLVPSQANYGIHLPAGLIAYDVDNPGAAPHRDLPKTWGQKTRRGYHLIYLYDGPRTNVKLPEGDLKAKGYVVGPSSTVAGFTYEWNGLMPVPAPAWMQAMMIDAAVPVTDSSPTVELDGIPRGSHDHFLHNLGSWLRGQWGLSENAIRDFLRSAVENGALEGVDPNDPYTDVDFERIARSCAKYDPATLIPAGHYRTSDEVSAIPPIPDWALPGFVPFGELTILFGPGKIGKSSFGSWLAAHVTRMGHDVLFIPSGEEPFELFVARARESSGLGPGKIYELPAEGFNLTEKGIKALVIAMQALPTVKLVWFDALYSHFGPGQEHEDAATRARSRLKPVALLAKETGAAIVGVVHTTKDGSQMLGSGELRNVARSTLKASRNGSGPFELEQTGTNLWAPTYRLTYDGREIPILGTDGQPYKFQDVFGQEVTHSMWALVLSGKREPGESSSSEVDNRSTELEELRNRAIRLMLETGKVPSREKLIEIGFGDKTARKAQDELKDIHGQVLSKKWKNVE